MLKRAILGILLIFLGNLAQAEAKQSLELIKQKIELYVLNEISSQNNDEIQVSAEKIDSRLNLKACHDDKLQVFNPYKTPILNTTTMGIKCQEEDIHWTLYVPIRISLKKLVLVANHPLTKGTQITDNDIVESKIDASQLKQGYFTNRSDVVGLICVQNVSEGTALSPNNLQTAFLVHKGDQVSILAMNEMINVSMNGIALTDGAMGDMIKVQNLTSKRILEGQVSANRQVRVTI